MSSTTSQGRPFAVEEAAVWRGLLCVHLQVLRDLDRELGRRHGLPVREFDVLITLFRAADWRLPMSELAERVLLSPSGLTRMVARLEREGWVQRRVDPADARSYLATLTDGGAQHLVEARVTHNEIIRRLFLDRLSAQELRSLAVIWPKVLREQARVLEDAEPCRDEASARQQPLDHLRP
jgi:DNA-binding MarR family transcriptional regulator